MNSIKKRFMFLLSAAALLMGSSCSDQWEADEVSGTQSQTLWQVISSDPQLSEFTSVLQTNGYDAILNSSGAFTVLAPLNGNINKVAASNRNEIPGSHIAYLEYNKSHLDTMTYLTMSNGKQIVLDSMRLTTKEIVCRNGILRFANYASSRQPNIYERLGELKDQYEMAAFVLSLGDSVMDMDKSVQIGLNQDNQPVYDTIMKFSNPLLDKLPLNDNDSLVNLVLLDNATFNALSEKYWPFYKKNDGLNPDPTYSEFKIDTAATYALVHFDLVRDLTCSLENSVVGTPEYVSTAGLKIIMSDAKVDKVVRASNGNIQIASGVKIRLKDNKIKDVYVEAEDYYYENETYVYTRIDPYSRGGKNVMVAGVDSSRTYQAYYVDEDGVMHKDSIVTVGPSYYYPSLNSRKTINDAYGGPVLGLRAKLFACDYKVYWRSVDDQAYRCQPDPACVDYAKYQQNPNYPCGGVVRNIQKLYLSQPGDKELVYSHSPTTNDFVMNYTSNNIFSGTYRSYTCMAGYDPSADLATEVGPQGDFRRMGINAGVGITDPNYETPLLWCSSPTKFNNNTVSNVYSGITGISTNTREMNNRTTQKFTLIPYNIFRCMYNGEMTMFVTGAPFNFDNTGKPSTTSCHGSIFLDYIRFEPVFSTVMLGEDFYEKYPEEKD